MTKILQKLTEKVKNFINSIRIPRLLSFFITKDGKINPTLEETLADAPPKKSNWERIGLGKVAIGPFKRWHVILLPVLLIVIRYGSEALQFFIQIIAQFAALIPLLLVGYFIYRSYFKKKD